jgi:hypothetical protein
MTSPHLAIGRRPPIVYHSHGGATAEVAQHAESALRLDMLDLIEIELTRVRRMAEHADDGFLLYLLDMAILEANQRARSFAENRASAADEARRLESGSVESRHNLAAELKVVR